MDGAVRLPAMALVRGETVSDLVTHFIGGVPVAEGATFAARGPVTGRRVREVRQADPAVPSEPTTITIRLEPRG